MRGAVGPRGAVSDRTPGEAGTSGTSPETGGVGGFGAGATGGAGSGVGAGPYTPRGLRRLSNREYDNVVRGLLGDTSHPATTFIADVYQNGYDNGSTGLVVQSDQVDAYQVAAEALAETAVAARMPRLLAWRSRRSCCRPSFCTATLVVWANEIGRGDHDQRNMPVVFLGLNGRGLPAGGRVVDAGEQPFNRLGCSILNLMDRPAAGFGDRPDCGVFAGLL